MLFRSAGLAGARHAGEHHQRITRNIDVDVFEVVLAGPAHAYETGEISGGISRHNGKLGNGRKLHTQAAARHPKKRGLGVGGAGRYFGNALNFRLMKSVRFLLIALLLSVWGMVGCASSAYRQRPEKMFRVSGYVLDAVSRIPVPGVVVNSYGVVVKGNNSWGVGDHTRTDAGGHFVLRLPVRGRAAVKKVEVRICFYMKGRQQFQPIQHNKLSFC